MIVDLRRVPWALWVFAVVTVGVVFVVLLARDRTRGNGVDWLAFALLLAMTVGVLLGSRVAWWIATVFMGFAVISTPFDSRVLWWAFALNVIAVGGLLATQSRAHCGVGSASVGQTQR